MRLRVSELESGSVSWADVVYELLNRVRLHELLADEVHLHVRPFCLAHGLNTEALLLTYIHDVVSAGHEWRTAVLRCRLGRRN